MPLQSNASASSFVTKSEVSCFKLKGEDCHFSHTNERAQGSIGSCDVSIDYAIAGVLDGHGGKKAAEYSSKQVPIVFASLLHERLPYVLEKLDMEPYLQLDHVSEEQQRIWALQDALAEVTPAALRDTFIKVHDDFLTKDVDSGTTATVVVLSGWHIITANVGDSLAYADLGTKVQQLTSSHRIDENTSEQRRIESSGGELGQAALDGKPVGPLRVWPGGLAFSRSLGDRHAGERVLSEPEVSQLLLDERGARVILASDGLWDMLTGKNAAHRVRTVACSKAAARLRSIAKDQRDRDDITVIVLDALDDPNARIPAAMTSSTESRRPDSSAIHQLWHPLTCSEHRSKEQWSHVMQTRCPADSEMTRSSDQEVSASVEEAASEQTSMPALLYEEVRCFTSTLNATPTSEEEWIDVPIKHSSRSQSQHNHQENLQHDTSASVNACGLSATEDGTEEPKMSQGGRGRGRGRGRGQGRFGIAGRGRGRGRNMHSSDPANTPANGVAGAGVANIEFTHTLSGSNGTPRGAGSVPEKRRNARRGRHAHRRPGGRGNGHAHEGPSEKRVSVQQVFAAS